MADFFNFTFLIDINTIFKLYLLTNLGQLIPGDGKLLSLEPIVLQSLTQHLLVYVKFYWNTHTQLLIQDCFCASMAQVSRDHQRPYGLKSKKKKKKSTIQPFTKKFALPILPFFLLAILSPTSFPLHPLSYWLNPIEELTPLLPLV